MCTRRKFMLVSALIFLSCFATTGRTEYPNKIVSEPFNMRVVEIHFQDFTYDLPVKEREKLISFGKNITKGTILPMHECDFDVFVIEGFRETESTDDLVFLDELFTKRARHIRDVLTPLGIPEGAGVTIKPSENEPRTKQEINTVSINVVYWPHRENERISSAHVKCKFGNGLR